MDVMYAGFARRKNQSQKRPVHLSSALALRAMCSFYFMPVLYTLLSKPEYLTPDK